MCKRKALQVLRLRREFPQFEQTETELEFVASTLEETVLDELAADARDGRFRETSTTCDLGNAETAVGGPECG
ncbi:hypothetical protein K8P10_002692 [Leucobacter sp. Psy1]|nr:hypothetical protein K8P10_002692 [Leucobacter sp. Psy1]